MVGRGEERLGGGSMGWRVRADEEGEIEVREGGVGRASATICAGCSGRCRSLWRQLSAAGPLWGCYTRPSFKGAAALEHSLCYLQVMLLLFWFSLSCCFFFVSFQTRTGMIQNYNLAFVYWHVGAADIGWHWLEEIWSKFCVLIIQSFAVSCPIISFFYFFLCVSNC